MCCQWLMPDTMLQVCSPASLVMPACCSLVAACTSGVMHQHAALATTAAQVQSLHNQLLANAKKKMPTHMGG